SSFQKISRSRGGFAQIPPIPDIPANSFQKIRSLTRRIRANTAHAGYSGNLISENQVAHAADSRKYRPYHAFFV
ncbi:MAG: hypothetical protein VZQ80_05360, partial [Lachnospiraceae bacterium]|nr:hypothetical protein [Lachnospiraceae bacterium]